MQFPRKIPIGHDYPDTAKNVKNLVENGKMRIVNLVENGISALKNLVGNVGKPLGDVVHRKLMRDFRLYMLVGGMPQAVAAYIKTNNFAAVDLVKRDIIALYEEDFGKIDDPGLKC